MAISRSTKDVTALLIEAGNGDPEAAEQLWTSIYPELREVAHRALLYRHSSQTLQTTALVNEAYLKLVPRQPTDWSGRKHFFAVAAKAMRHILIDYAKQKSREKRGGGRLPVTLDENLVAAGERADVFIALDEALTILAQQDERLAQVVEYRFFGGLSEAEIGDLLQLSERTIRRDWRKARAWLAVALSESTSKS